MRLRHRKPPGVYVSLYIRGVPQFVDRLCEPQNDLRNRVGAVHDRVDSGLRAVGPALGVDPPAVNTSSGESGANSSEAFMRSIISSRSFMFVSPLVGGARDMMSRAFLPVVLGGLRPVAVSRGRPVFD